MGAAEIKAFLTYLAVQENVAASRQNQALNAIVFLYHEVLKQDIGLYTETQAVLQNVTGIYQLVAQILYGTGLRLNEALCLRVKDVDFAQQQIIVQNTKGWESRVTMLPSIVIPPTTTSARLGARIWLRLSPLCLSESIPMQINGQLRFKSDGKISA